MCLCAFRLPPFFAYLEKEDCRLKERSDNGGTDGEYGELTE
jgi:hypothetical protein